MNSAAQGPYNLWMTERDEGRLEVEGWQEQLVGMAGKKCWQKEAVDACVFHVVISLFFYLDSYFRSFQFEQLVINSTDLTSQRVRT
jgi:hypothetical protein